VSTLAALAGALLVAQLPPGEPPSEPETLEAAPEPDAYDDPYDPSSLVPPEPDPAWLRYHAAIRLYLLGGQGEARQQLVKLVEDFPGHPAAEAALELMPLVRERAARIPPPKPGSPRRQPHLEEPETRVYPKDRAFRGYEKEESLARSELVLFQTVHGAVIGGELCGIVDCDDQTAVVLGLAGGGAIGLATSLAASRHGITPGEALAVNSGATWGFWHALTLSGAAGVDDDSRFTLLLVGQLVGTGLGAATAHGATPTAGQVALVNSAGLWAGVVAAFAHGATDFNADDQAFYLSLLAATDLVGIGAALIGRDYPPSRGRMLLIDATGLMGMLFGLAVDVLIESGGSSPEGLSGFAIAGTLTGLALGTYASRTWDAPDLEVQAAFIPRDGGGVATVGVGF
jgi:hypothetical protein